MADLQINASLHNSRTVQRFVQSGNEAKAVLQLPPEKPNIGESTSVQMSTTNPIAKRPSIVKEETNPMMGGGGSHRLPSRRLSVREQILEEKISAQGRRPSATGGSSTDGTQIVSDDAATSAYAEELRRQLTQERSMIDNMKVQVRHNRQSSAAVIIQFTAVCPFGAFSYIIIITVVDDKCCYLLLSYICT